MAVLEATQALLGAFFFGVLFNGASAALLLYAIGYGSAIFRDGLRLVLILFLASSAAWALVEFLSTIIEPTAASTCQVAVIFSSTFDQLGRVFLEQYLVWAVRTEGKKVFSAVPQVLVLGRFGVGMAFVGLTRNEFNPTCVPVSSVQPVAIVSIALDAVMITLVAIRVFSTSPTKDVSSDQVSQTRKSVILVIIGLAIWTGMSVVLLLGMKATALVLKTTLPALGLAILVALITLLSGTLVAPRGPPPRRPDSPTARNVGQDRDLSSSDSTDYPPSRYEDVKAMNTRAMSAYVSGNGGAMVDGGLPGQVNIILPTETIEMGGARKKITKGSAWAKSKGGKLVISNPIIKEAEGMGNPLDRIPTIDLATAASNEKERRIRLAQVDLALIAQRPAPQPPAFFEQPRTLAREVSLKRKEIAPSSELGRSTSTKTTKTSGGLSVEANASSTSSELSPGTEKIRRRSPRQPLAPSIPATFQPIRPGEPVRIPIPRPRSPPQSPKAPEPVKTPLQRRPTTGLPSNPRAQATKAMAKEAKDQRQETVMFINNIVYDDPNAVNNIVQGASKTPMTSLDSADSVVNRPRPIPRKGDKDRQVFPAELSPHGHRRTKSGGSVASRKSILQSMPGSPTQLPPLPPPPKSAGNVVRPHPNDTKSMTFNEKMDILYTSAPASAPSSATTTSKRRSTVPEIPPVPTVYTAPTQLPADEGVFDPEANSDRRVSKTTDRSSIRTTSILGIEDIPQRQTQREVSTRNAVDELGQSWLPGISAENERQQRQLRNKTDRKSSPVIPVGSRFSMSSAKTENKTREDDASTVWGSVHSPVAAVDVYQTRRNARSTYIRKDSRGSEEEIKQDMPANIPSEVMTVMLADDDQKPLLRDEKVHAEIPVFHRRIGDECPTFSTRKDKGRLRKMPPPAPLVLNGRSTKRAVIVQAAEPSPLESPEAAYQMIQAQLQRFEQPNRDSVESQGHQRLALLENLEREMGQLENRWQTRLERDSMSSIQSSPSKDSRPPSIAERRASRRASIRNSALRSVSEYNVGTLSSQSSGPSSENTQASVWQARLADAQMQYMKNTPDLIMKRNNLNFLSVSKAALGSPSPPDTDESGSEYEDEAPPSVQLLSPRVYQPAVQVHALWRPQSPIQHPISFGLWVGSANKSRESNGVDELPGLSVRPVIRKTSDPLPIFSLKLWQKPAEMSSVDAANELWKKYAPSPPTRPVTIRPPRRNKRVTLLPDILENPEPLPNKRGTLAIFQFPWGEKSEHATIQPQPSRAYMAMPGTMTTGGPMLNASLEARSRQLEAEEFMTSFFDDYEAEEDGDNFGDFSDSDREGDDFDENTLWEIASLLKTDKLPSKNSLLPLPQLPSDSPLSASYPPELSNEDYHSDNIVSEEPIPVDRLSLPTSEPVLARSPLWTAQPAAVEFRATVGLPQPDSATWKSYVTEPLEITRSNVRVKEIAPIQSTQLWAPETKNASLVDTGLLWSTSKPVYSMPVVSSHNMAAATAKLSLLWVRPVTTLASDMSGLFDVSHSRVDYRRTSKEPAAVMMARKPRAMAVSLEKLVSKSLWTGETATQSALLWEKPIVMRIPGSDSGLFDVNIPRFDYRRTTKEPAAISTQTTPRATKEPLALLQTRNLWSKNVLASPPSVYGAQLFTPKQPVVASRSAKADATLNAQSVLLWEKPTATLEPQHKGLFDTSVPRYNYRRTSKIPAAIFMSTKLRSSNGPLPMLTTTSLWTGETVEQELPAMVKSSPIPQDIPASIVANWLWEETTLAIPMSEHEGLFDVNVARIDYRRSSKLPAAINTTRKPRKMGEPLATLTSTKLWEIQTKLTHVSAPKTFSLWDKPTLSMPITAGLFQLDSNRKVYRTTSAEPAALAITRKPRIVNESLPTIESYHLWTSSQITSVELDWITISSVRPRSPSVSSTSSTSSAPSSPATDSSSVKTNTTKASSAKSTGSFFSSWFGKKKEPEVGDVPKVPSVPELPEEFVVKNLDEIPHEKPARIPLRQLHRPSVAYRADWNDALREAVAESYPGTMAALRASYPQDWEGALQAAIKASHIAPKIVRKAASPRDWSMSLHEATLASYPEIRFSRGPLRAVRGQWEAALQEAIAESQPSQIADFDVAVRHPVFMGSLETTAETIHPAIGPKVLRPRGSSKAQPNIPAQPANFDVTVRHPVFFGSMKTMAKMVHPAIAIETKDSKRNDIAAAPMLWAKSSKIGATTKGMWASSDSAVDAQATSFNTEIAVVRNNLRKTKENARASEMDAKPDFREQGMWKRGGMLESRSQDRDWLEDSMKKRFSRVELRY
ncbi:hypothetical protein F4820DRAFT_347789 [Hypoxylon rubiginosum]|uniref:Uncharacterized protein n=1 Tax=Hypoxylon rubiginosum TaxID=110542 RepID=A0ACB9YYG6_9PEZI|nr:hypothetical protein F4820DRAFT_347789 [Hypoxylon rubiginosum]